MLEVLLVDGQVAGCENREQEALENDKIGIPRKQKLIHSYAGKTGNRQVFLHMAVRTPVQPSNLQFLYRKHGPLRLCDQRVRICCSLSNQDG